MPTGLNMQTGIATLADAATAELRERILSGELESGSPLRLEELARSLGMSISPIREAVRKLETLGLAVHVAHRGSRVKELDLDDLRDTYEARLALEPVAVARAAGRISEREVEQARAELVNYTLYHERGDRPAARAAHDAFHFTLYSASGSEWLVRLIRPAWENSERYRALATPSVGGHPHAPARARAHPRGLRVRRWRVRCTRAAVASRTDRARGRRAARGADDGDQRSLRGRYLASSGAASAVRAICAQRTPARSTTRSGRPEPSRAPSGTRPRGPEGRAARVPGGRSSSQRPSRAGREARRRGTRTARSRASTGRPDGRRRLPRSARARDSRSSPPAPLPCDPAACRHLVRPRSVR